MTMRNVTSHEYVGACRYTGYVAKSIKLLLECGHENYRKASQGVPERAKCRDCSLGRSPVVLGEDRA
jgi:hypothetical protein